VKTGHSIPYRYSPDSTAAGIKQAYGELEPGSETGDIVVAAGRLMLRRVQGKLTFGQLADSTGRIQLFATVRDTPDFDEFGQLSLGDWIGVRGEVMTTRKGELSIKVLEWSVLAETRRPFPDKWHGINDPDTRYRQRYVDLWVTDEARQTLTIRSQLISLTRRWLEDRGFMEVETPALHSVPGGALARPFSTFHNALDQEMFLRIAPELYLKRLVVGGFEKVFEIARVFRNEGISPRHNPEFTMLELYQAYADWTDIMELVEQLVSYLAVELTGSTTITYQDREIELAAPWRRASLSTLIEEQIGLSLSVDTPIEELRNLCDKHSIEWKESYGPGKLLLEIYEKTAEAKQWQPVFVTEYPIEVSPLARPHRDLPGMTERFEAIVAGRELCNAFSELLDPDDQRERFEDQVRERDNGDEEAMAVDEDYLRALEYGLPPTGGLGIGIDRLVMLLTNSATIRDVVMFPTLRPEQERGSASIEAED